jgi:hypothetical protein
MVIKRLCYRYKQNEDNNVSSLNIHEEMISANVQNEEVTYIPTCVLIYSMPHCMITSVSLYYTDTVRYVLS